MSSTFTCHVSTYQQFTPTEGDGWRREELTFARDRVGLVVMHAWEPPVDGQAPGWVRAVPYLKKAARILPEVFPPLLGAFRQQGLPILHVPGARPGEQIHPTQVPSDPTWKNLRRYRHDQVFPGAPNHADIAAAYPHRQPAAAASPLPGEGIAETGPELHALASAHGLNHLIYVGFALNWCLLMSPGGMVDMKRYGYLCSAVADGIVTVEPGADPNGTREHESALWRVAVEFGFVFRAPDLIASLSAS